jgi:acyl carrier protein
VSGDHRTIASEQDAGSLPTIVRILSQSLNLSAAEISMESRLEDLGVDSLVAVEIINFLKEAFGCDISSEAFASADDVASLAALVTRFSGNGSPETTPGTTPSSTAISTAQTTPGSMTTDNGAATPAQTELAQPSKASSTSIHKVFQSIRQNFDAQAEATGLLGYWDKVYPEQLTVVTAFIAEAFEKLGCPIKDFAIGQKLPALANTVGKYQREVARLWDILEEGGLVDKHGSDYVRGPAPLPSEVHRKSAKMLSAELIGHFPQFASTHGLPDLLGPHLADFLTGKADPVALLFGSDHGRDLLGDFYANGPDLRACTDVLCEFVTAAVQARASHSEPFQVIEIGAGTGSTTKYLLPLLQKAGIPFRYTFTELSGSLLARAKNVLFKGVSGMDFLKFDIEKGPPAELLGRYHLVVSSNCVHATRNLQRSLTNIRKLLRPQDGCMALVELTQKLAWYDLVWGLLDGWWLFDDGRQYALQSPWAWERAARAADFAHVDWSENASRESRSVRVIFATTSEPDSKVPVNVTSALLHRPKNVPLTHPNLFLLPDGFGRAAVFRPLQPYLDNVQDVSVYALNSPFLKKHYGHTDVPTIEELAGLYVAEIKRRQPDGPYMLGGYSIGGLVAYEAARQLLENADEVEKLLLVDTACPTFTTSMPDSLVDVLDGVNVTGAKPDAELSDATKPLPIKSEHFTFSRRQLQIYRASKLPGRRIPHTILFSARSGVMDKQIRVARPSVRPEEQNIADWFLDDGPDGPLGWDELLPSSSLEVVRVEGNHFDMMRAPNVSSLFVLTLLQCCRSQATTQPRTQAAKLTSTTGR